MLLSEYNCITFYSNDVVFTENNDDFSARKWEPEKKKYQKFRALVIFQNMGVPWHPRLEQACVATTVPSLEGGAEETLNPSELGG